MERVDATNFDKDGAPVESSSFPWSSPRRPRAVCLAYPVGIRDKRDRLDMQCFRSWQLHATQETKKRPSASGTGSSNQVDKDRPHWAPAIARLKPSRKRLTRKTRFQPAETRYVGNSGSHGFFLLFPLSHSHSPTLCGLLRKPEATLVPVWTRAVTPKCCNVSRKGGASGPPAFSLGFRCRLESWRVGGSEGRVDRHKQP